MAREHRFDIQTLQHRLPEIIRGLGVGEEVTITDGGRTVARLLGPAAEPPRPRVPGSARGKLLILEEDDEHLTDFADYMP
jgi:antitoxin (DNA-binding transcriptional repressor) of toxin-antitoxin stability system